MADDEDAFARAEFERLSISDEKLASLCIQNSAALLPSQKDAAQAVTKLILTAIEQGRPLSLVRVGDGEGNALGVVDGAPSPLHLKYFNLKFASQNGTVLNADEAHAFSSALKDAILDADILGFRVFGRAAAAVPELFMIENNINNGLASAAMGMLYPREFLRHGLSNGTFSNKTITTAWIHLALIPHLSAILDAAKRVMIITGRSELTEQFEKRLGDRLISFLTVPVQGYRPANDQDSHFRRVYPRILEALAADLRGTLVLVGAGFLGKIYCETAKRSGAVAVDMGSAFDVLAGLETRGVHARYDIQSLRWI